MPDYRVIWHIDQIDADTPVGAALEVLRIHRDPDSIATVFDVHDSNGARYRVDLDEHLPVPRHRARTVDNTASQTHRLVRRPPNLVGWGPRLPARPPTRCVRAHERNSIDGLDRPVVPCVRSSPDR